RAMGRLLWWRGTKDGLTGLLEQATGRRVDVIDNRGVYRPGEAPTRPRHVLAWAEEGGLTNDQHLLAFIHRQDPADATFEPRAGAPRPAPAARPRPRPAAAAPRLPATVAVVRLAGHRGAACAAGDPDADRIAGPPQPVDVNGDYLIFVSFSGLCGSLVVSVV